MKILAPALWGDFYLSKEDGKPVVKNGARGKGKPPLFVMLVLTTLWEIYGAISIKKDMEKLTKILTALKIKMSPRDTQGDHKALLHAIFSQWLPLGPACLDVVCSLLPSPNHIKLERVQQLMYSVLA